MRADSDWATWSEERRRRVETSLAAALAATPHLPESLLAPMRYAVLGGGKRVRPLLAYAAGELAGAAPAAVDAPAAAVELIHAYSLVHDDLPCMDDDVLRRGRPTCHVQFGEAPALLAGDALQALAFAVLARAPHATAASCALLADRAGAAGMAGGQAIDLAAVGGTLDVPALERMHRMKTGALIGAAVQLGAAAGGNPAPEVVRALDGYARAAGLAFQVVDDILDVEGSATSLGKTAGKDAAQNKPTFVSMLGLAAAKARAAELRAEALSALAPFGARARRLLELAEWIVGRTA